MFEFPVSDNRGSLHMLDIETYFFQNMMQNDKKLVLSLV